MALQTRHTHPPVCQAHAEGVPQQLWDGSARRQGAMWVLTNAQARTEDGALKEQSGHSSVPMSLQAACGTAVSDSLSCALTRLFLRYNQ
jgi:hypothetical protein